MKRVLFCATVLLASCREGSVENPPVVPQASGETASGEQQVTRIGVGETYRGRFAKITPRQPETGTAVVRDFGEEVTVNDALILRFDVENISEGAVFSPLLAVMVKDQYGNAAEFVDSPSIELKDSKELQPGESGLSVNVYRPKNPKATSYSCFVVNSVNEETDAFQFEFTLD